MMRRCRFIFGTLALLGTAVLVSAQQAAAPPRITAEDVVQSLRDHGVEIAASQIDLPDFPARKGHPELELMKVEPLPDGTSRVLFHCADKASCIPFYVVLRGMTRDFRAEYRHQGAPRKQLAHDAAHRSVLIKRGASAMLEMVSPTMVITLPVICLENGSQGERIKVTSADRKSTYLGEIVAPGMLRTQL
jgi:hypothetical protein